MSSGWAWIAGMAAAVSGCSSSNPVTPVNVGTDGGQDASSPPPGMDASTPPMSDAGGTVTPDANPRATACTAAPYINFSATMTLLDVSGTTQPLVGATVGFSTCPGFKVTTDATGTATTQLTEGIPISPIYGDGTTILGAIGAEIPATGDVALNETVFATDVTAAIPGFAQDGGNAATIAITIAVDPSATAPCSDVTGVTLAVTGHAEAVVSYANPSWPKNPAATTTSSTGPYVFINGIVGASKVALTGAKSGCTVNLATSSQTGEFLLVAGGVTIGAATVTN